MQLILVLAEGRNVKITDGLSAFVHYFLYCEHHFANISIKKIFFDGN